MYIQPCSIGRVVVCLEGIFGIITKLLYILVVFLWLTEVYKKSKIIQDLVYNACILCIYG